jgi:transmembrane 9 superfamily protein 2/4
MFVSIAFACLGFLSPANRGALMTCAMVLYVCLGTTAGYVSARIYKSFGGEKWKSNVLLTSMLSPGYAIPQLNTFISLIYMCLIINFTNIYLFSLVFSLFFIMNLIFWAKDSSAAVPFSTLVTILALWFGISVPLTFIGAYFGFKKRVSQSIFNY